MNRKYYQAFTKPSRGTNESERRTITIGNRAFRFDCERCRLTRGAVDRANKKAAFTLAEVLVTLGIIGVVAALTMPTLIQHHKKHVVETKLAKFASTYRQAIKMSEAENGPVGGWTTQHLNGSYYYDHYKTYLDKYIKTTSHKIFNDGVMFALADGSGFFYYYDIGFCVDYKDCIKTMEKIGWVQGGRYINGKNTFLFHYDGRSYADGNPTLEEMRENCKETYGLFCTKLIERNGWKIPKDYPLKF